MLVAFLGLFESSFPSFLPAYFIITYERCLFEECEVKWALGNITTNKASRGDGIPVELFHRSGKAQFSFQSQRKAMPKNAQTTAQFYSSQHASKVMLKILQARLQQ